MYSIKILLTCGGYGRGWYYLHDKDNNSLEFDSLKEAQEYAKTEYPNHETKVVFSERLTKEV